jgi:hypothetical protein
MTENFDVNLTEDASKFENLLTDELKNQLKQIREIYTKINILVFYTKMLI